ncbi:hypothetical protein EDB80DRAFT_688650 [Ilyonectria destructans]|nr:hypothetical protein EDB80DRAFT_688650 [Ilyonectria destructans]
MLDAYKMLRHPRPYQQEYGNGRETAADELYADEADTEVIVGGLGDTELGDDSALWAQACHFFRHNVEDKETGVKLPGLTVASRNYQMVDAYEMLRACDSVKYNGTLNASKPGLGKTFEVLMAAAAIALAHLSREHFKAHPEEHLAEGKGVCALGHPFGITCICIEDGLTRRICQRANRAPQLVVAPAGIVNQWLHEGSRLLEPKVQFMHGNDVIRTVNEPLLLMASASNGTIHHTIKISSHGI